MDAKTRNMIETELKNLIAVIEGKTVNGVKLGDEGITVEWVKQAIIDLSTLLS
jgi:hypothetical protein